MVDLLLFHGPRMRPGGLGGPQDQAMRNVIYSGDSMKFEDWDGRGGMLNAKKE